MNAEPAGSWSWQLLFLSIATVIVLLEGLRGWRQGLARQIVRLCALIAAYTVARFAGAATLPLGRALIKWPDPLLSIIGGAILGLVSYVVIVALGAFFFKRTAQQASRFLRLLYGMSGAVFGLVFGIFIVWLLFMTVRLVGSVAEAQLRPTSLLAASQVQPVWHRRLRFSQGQVTAAPTPSPLLETLAKIKESVEGGTLGGNLKSTDPLPGSIYQRLGRLSEVSTKPDAVERFLDYPGARQLSENPKIAALRDDPLVFQLAAQGRIFDLLKNPKVLNAANDPVLRAQVTKFDLDKALDYALGQ